MLYYNINNPVEKVSLFSAVMRSVSENTGLYMPETIPCFPESFFREMRDNELPGIAYQVTRPLMTPDIPDESIKLITSDALNFDIPLERLDENIYVLELFHGPTYAFKDVGARFLAGVLGYITQSLNRKITVLVATSGDTGGAVANAFAGKEGIKVVILYPSGRVSRVQEFQLKYAAPNITAIELEGDFDDCQRLVRTAFADRELNEKIILTSANSINFARLFPQSVYYFYALAQMENITSPVVISVPSGNFGNLTAGLIASKMGLPVSRFIASTNINNSVPLYLKTGKFVPHPSYHTISNAMDVGNPGNFQRMLSLFGNDYSQIKKALAGYWFTDEQTIEAMHELYEKYSYIADPHSAVAYLGLKSYMAGTPSTGIFLATAHPGKFPEEVEKATGVKVTLPVSDSEPVWKSEHFKAPDDYNFLREFLCSTF
ncbi:MAG: threonine synthase [Bacteroidales bacterium]|nr:threonine synthase [Bacteroidales bacterium]